MEGRERDLFDAVADVVDDGHLHADGSEDTYVGQTGVETPGDDVAYFEWGREFIAGDGNFGCPELGSGALPVGFEVEDAAMVDAGVGSVFAPSFAGRVDVEGAKHVFVDQLLQVEGEGVAGGADDDVGADAGLARDVAVGVGDAGVVGVVAEGYA